MVEDKITLAEIAEKLDSLVASINRLTEIVLENQISLAAIKTPLPAKQPERVNRYETGPRRHDERVDKSMGMSREPYSEPLPDESSFIPMYPPNPVEEIQGSDESKEEKIKKWEEENPW